MAPSNVELLTAHKRRKKDEKKPAPIVFDPKSRQEFLTGFHKKKKNEKTKKIEKYKRLEEEAKRERRREKRKRLSAAVSSFVAEVSAESHSATKNITESTINEDDRKVTITIEDERKGKAASLRLQYPDRIPIICEKLASSDLPDLVSERFLVPGEFTVGNLMTIIRNRIKIGPEKSIFLFVGNSLLPAHLPLLTVYQQKQDLDGFLYVLYSGENTFGCGQ